MGSPDEATQRGLPERLLLLGVALAVALGLIVVPAALPAGAPLAPPPAEAAVQSPFNAVYSSDQNGAIATIGNSSMDCPATSSGCAAARAGTASGAALNNNSYPMQFTDVDGDSSTSNSSTSTLSMPAGSDVLNARLIWGGRTTAGSGGAAASGTSANVKLKAPGQGGYNSLSGTTKGFSQTSPTTTDGAPYQGSIDVTDTVKAAGNGVYSVGDINAATGADRYAGWSLVVAYRNPSLPLRNLTVFEGFADVTTTSAANSTVDIPISGFLTPTSGAVNASVGVVGWEGDQGTAGDSLSMSGTALSDATRPSNNFFDSKVSDNGVDQTGRNPEYPNNFGVDVGRVSANNVLANGATSATLRLTTSGDYYYPGAVTSQIDLFTPSFNAVSKTAVDTNGNDPAQPGDTLEYSVSLTNTGADPADRSVLRDVLPANTTYVPGSLRRTASPGQTGGLAVSDGAGDDVGEYDAASRSIRMRVGSGSSTTAGGTLAPNDTASFTFRATLDRASAGTTVANTAALDYRARTLGRNYTYTGNTVNTPVSALADLQATKTGAPAAQSAGGNVTYTIDATNRGPNPTGRTTLVDTLPAGVTFVSASPPAGTTCSPSGQTVTCAGSAVATNAALTVPITVRVAPEAATGSVTNSVQVSSDLADDVTTNNVATAPTQVTRNADLGITTAFTGPAVAGQNVTQTSTVTNRGPSTAEGTVVTTPVPTGATFVSGSIPGGSCAATGGNVTCTLTEPLAPGASAAAALVFRVLPGTPAGTLGSSATATSSTPDSVPANNSATTSIPLAAQTDVAVTATGPAQIIAGGRYTYNVTVTNNGPSDARDVGLLDTTITRLTPVSVQSSQGTCSLTSNPPGCALGTLPAGASATIVAVADAPPSLTPGTQVASARVSTSTTDTVAANNTTSVTTPVSRQSDVGVSISGLSPAIAGQNATYTLNARNTGPSDAGSTVVTTTLPPDITPTGGTFPGGSCTVSGQTLSCALGTLTPNQTVQIAVTSRVAANRVPGPAQISAQIQSASTDPQPGDNTAAASLGVDAVADLALTATEVPPTVVAGNQVVYTLTARNEGPSLATGVRLTDTFPEGLTPVSTDNPGCSISGKTVTCGLGALAPGAQVPVKVTATVDPTRAAGPITNSANVTAAAPGDPSTSNNSAQVSTQVVTQADLGVSVRTPPPTAVAGGAQVEAVIRVTNNGPSATDGQLVVENLPPNLQPATPASGTNCAIANQQIACPFGSIAPGGFVDIPIAGIAPANTPAGIQSFGLRVSSSAPDSVAANNRVQLDVPVVTSADVRTTIEPDPATAPNNTLVAGSRATYRVSATNAGPSDAATTATSITLPAGTTPVSAVSSIGTCTITGQRVDCPEGTVPAGSAATITLTVDVAPNATGPLAVTASSTSPTPDPDGANNAARSELPVVASANLSVTLSATPEPVRAGATETYTALVTNDGPSNAADVTFEIALPPGFTVAPGGVSTSAGECTVDPSGSPVRCRLGAVPAGTTVPVVIKGLVPPDLPDGTVTATASVASPTPDAFPDDRTASATTTVTRSADLAVTLSPQKDTADAGQPSGYVLSVANNGPSTAADVVSTTPVPAGTTATSAVSSAGPCSVGGGQVSCPIGTLAPGAVATVRIDLTLASSFTGPLGVSTSVASGTPDPNAANDAASVTQSTVARADMATAVALTSGPPVAGGTATYRITARNEGPADATGVTVGSRIPAGATYVSSSSPSGSCSVSASVLSCALGALPAGQETVVDVTVSLPPDAAGRPLDISASSGSTLTDPDAGNNSASTSAPVVAQADLAVAVGAITASPTAGQEVRWQATVRNNGPSVATGVTLTDRSPDGVRITGAELAPGAGTCTPASGPRETGVDCALADLAVGAETVVTLIGVVDADLPNPEIATTVAVATRGATDPVAANDTATATTGVGTSADLRVTSAVSPDPLVAGRPATVTVTATNAGPSTARGVVVNDRLPDGFVIGSATLNGQPCTVSGQVVECAGVDLPAGAALTLTITGTVAPGAVGPTLSDVAGVRSGTPDPDLGNNTASGSGAVTAAADLATSIVPPPSITAGTPATWTVRTRNDGPSDAAGVVTTVSVPPFLTGVTATLGGATCRVDAGTITCPSGTVAAGATEEIVITGLVDPAADGADATVTATATAGTPDPDPSDDTATTTTPVTRNADLGVRTEVSADPAVPGREVTWTTTVRNDGPSTAVGASLTDTLPEGLLDVRATVAGRPCALDGTTVTCPLGDIAPGATTVVTVTGRVDPAYAGGPLVHSAQAASTTPDADPADDTARTETPVAAQADLRVGTAVPSGPPVAGAPVDIAVDVTNGGPSDAANTVVEIPIPPNVVLDPASVTSSAGECTVAGTVVRCELGTVAPNARVTITARGVVGQGAGTQIAVTATATSTTPDADPADNTSTAEATVGDSADLGITVSPPPQVVAGEAVSFPATVVNRGPSDARNAVVRLTAPPSLLDLAVTGVPADACQTVGGEIVCSLGTLTAGQTIAATVTGRIDPAATPGPRAYDVTVDSDTGDPDTRNNVAKPETTVVARADLGVAVAVDPLVPGQNGRAAVTVTNTGPSTAGGTVTVTLPEGVVLTGTPSVDGVPCRFVGRTLSCDVPPLAAGGTRTIDVPFAVLPGTPGPGLEFAAEIVSGVEDPDPADGRVTVTAPVSPQADLGVDLAGPERVVAGQPLQYTATVANNGPSDAADVVYTQRLPEGLEGVSVTSSQGTCQVTGLDLVCRLGAVGPGAPVQVTIAATGTVTADAVGPLTSSATVASPTGEPAAAPGTPDGRSDTVTTAVDTSADLAVSVVGPTAPVPGGPVAYQVTTRNDGPSTARDVVISLDVPDGMTDLAIDAPPGVTCDVATLRCTIPAVGPGADEAVAITVRGTLPPGTTGPVATTATAASSTPDPDPGDNTATGGGTAAATADVAVSQSVAPAPLVAGGPVTWSVQVTNYGPSTATDVVVTDVVPPGVTGVTISGPPGTTCDATRCLIPALAPGAAGAVTLTVTGTLPADAGPDAAVTNEVSVSTDTVDPVPGNDRNSLRTPLGTAADLGLTLAGPSEPVTAGTPFTYAVTVPSKGPSIAENVVVTIPAPAGVTLTGARPSQGECRVDGGTLVCDLGAVGPGATPTIEVDAVADPNADLDRTTATATVSSTTPDPTPADTSATTTTPLGRAAGLSVTKTITPAPVVPGRPATYTITVANAGPSAATGVSVTDRLAPSVRGGPPTSTAGTCGLERDLVTCGLGTVAPGAQVTVTVPVDVDAAAQADALSNTATVTSTSPDPDTADNTASVNGTAAPQADIGVRTVPDTPTATPGSPVSWTTTVTNAGPSAAPGAFVDLAIPAGVTDVTVVAPPGVTCSAPRDGRVTCDLGTLAPGAPVAISVRGTLSPTATSDQVLGVAAGASGAADPNDADNATSTPVDVTAEADLSVTKRAAGPVVAGTDVNWDVEVANAGPATAVGTVLTDRLPAGVSAVRTGDVACDVAEGVVRCPLGDLPANQRRTVRITALVDAAITGTTLANGATVTAQTPEPAVPGPGPNAATTNDVTGREAALGVTKEADSDEVAVGGTVTWTITASNEGPSAASEVAVTDELPGRGAPDPEEPDARVEVVSADSPDFDAATGVWSVGMLAPGEQRTLRITARVVSPGDLTNVARISPDGPEAGSGGTGTAGGGPSGPGSAGSGPPGTSVGDTDGSDDAASAGATGAPASTKPPGGWLAYTGAWVLPVLGAGLLALLAGAALFLIARRREEARA